MTEKLILKLLMHKNNIFAHISLSFIGAGDPCPHPHRSVKAYKHERRDYDDLVSLCLSFSFTFSFLSFLPSFFLSFYWQRRGAAPLDLHLELISNRSFVLKTSDGQQSRLYRLKNGVSQGSVLAPLLFNIYIHDLPDTISKKYGYADVLAILHIHRLLIFVYHPERK